VLRTLAFVCATHLVLHLYVMDLATTTRIQRVMAHLCFPPATIRHHSSLLTSASFRPPTRHFYRHPTPTTHPPTTTSATTRCLEHHTIHVPTRFLTHSSIHPLTTTTITRRLDHYTSRRTQPSTRSPPLSHAASIITTPHHHAPIHNHRTDTVDRGGLRSRHVQPQDVFQAARHERRRVP
jgi:hypothetical protein